MSTQQQQGPPSGHPLGPPPGYNAQYNAPPPGAYGQPAPPQGTNGYPATAPTGQQAWAQMPVPPGGATQAGPPAYYPGGIMPPPPPHGAVGLPSKQSLAVGFPAASQPVNIKVETWKCRPDGTPHTTGAFLKREAIMTVNPGETVHQLIDRLRSIHTAPVGLRLEGPVLLAQPSESMPVLHPKFFSTTPILGMVDPSHPRIIFRVMAKPSRMTFFGIPL